MISEKTKMISGELYDPFDPILVEERRLARIRAKVFNDGLELNAESRLRLLRELLPNAGRNLWIEPPFYCDYGSNIYIGDDVYFNFNCVVLDVCTVCIGSRVKIGPSVQLYSATHPLGYRERSSGREFGKPIEIRDDIWIGGGAIICPGVRIGARTVIGAGSVVTRDIPEDVFAAGNPCRVIRTIVDQ